MFSEQPVRGRYSSWVCIETVIPWILNYHRLDFESSSLEFWNRHLLDLEPSPHGSFHSKVTDPWGEGVVEEDKTIG